MEKNKELVYYLLNYNINLEDFQKLETIIANISMKRKYKIFERIESKILDAQIFHCLN